MKFTAHLTSVGSLVLGLLGGACSPTGTAGADACSVAGQQQTCTCAAAQPGTQTCGADLRYGACVCVPGKRMFATITAYSGNLMLAAGAGDGLAGGDKLCMQSAQAAMLGGTWKAWLSAPGFDAKSRIADVGPWFLLDGQTKVFNNLAQLTTAPSAPVDMTEQKTRLDALTGNGVWTGTDNGGTTAASAHCMGWTAMSGGVGTLVGRIGDAKFASTWTSAAAAQCTSSNHLYCLEQ